MRTGVKKLIPASVHKRSGRVRINGFKFQNNQRQSNSHRSLQTTYTSTPFESSKNLSYFTSVTSPS